MTLFGWRRGEAWKAQRRPRTRVLASGVTTLAVERRNERHAQDASERLPVLWRMSRRFCRGCERSPERIRRRQVEHWRGRWKNHWRRTGSIARNRRYFRWGRFRIATAGRPGFRPRRKK